LKEPETKVSYHCLQKRSARFFLVRKTGNVNLLELILSSPRRMFGAPDQNENIAILDDSEDDKPIEV
jgi:hypothetical protein